MSEGYETLALYIGGEWRQDTAGNTEPVLNPANGETLADLPHATAFDLDAALDAASRAFPSWRATPAFHRGCILKRAAGLIRERREAIARILTLEQGKPLTESLNEVAVSADTIEWYAEEAERAYGRVVPARVPGVCQMALREPVGPVAAFTPWNYPALTPARKIGGALAAGCTLVIKPAEETPGTAVAMARAFHDGGLPPGVLNVVFGDPAQLSEHLIRAPVICKASLTGSVPVGRKLARLAAEALKPITLELGGHAPVLVFDDVDPEAAARAAAAAKFRNAGQICVSPTRFFVHESIIDPFTRAFVEAAKALRVGDGLSPGTNMGPLCNARRVEAMQSLVANARARGARVAVGGERIGNRGYFFAPTVLTEVPHDARVMHEEPFGPLAPIVAFATVKEAVERANETRYGLAAFAFTRSLGIANALTGDVECGMLCINHFRVSTPATPFGGLKDSGYGREGGPEGLDAYLVTKLVSTDGA